MPHDHLLALLPSCHSRSDINSIEALVIVASLLTVKYIDLLLDDPMSDYATHVLDWKRLKFPKTLYLHQFQLTSKIDHWNYFTDFLP